MVVLSPAIYVGLGLSYDYVIASGKKLSITAQNLLPKFSCFYKIKNYQLRLLLAIILGRKSLWRIICLRVLTCLSENTYDIGISYAMRNVLLLLISMSETCFVLILL